MNLRDFKSVNDRRKAIENDLNIDLKNIGNYSLNSEIASSKNCENMIGAAQVPLGIAGPLKVNGVNFSDDYFIPLATTEGALVASVNRGAKAITESGGANSFVTRIGQTRGPVFETKSITHGKEAEEWIKNNFDKLNEIAKLTSSHIELLKLDIKVLATNLFVRFYFNTNEAMGMNMVTIATQKISEFIENETGIVLVSVAGNFDIDKKPSWLNFINNRGFSVLSEVVLKKDILEVLLKTTPEKFFQVWLDKCMLGSIMSGALGYNGQYANIVAANFIATGQDPAHVVEASMGITTAKILDNNELLVSVYLPSLNLGTVGGGTILETQSEALKLMKMKGESSEKYAQVLGAAVLAGEISLLSSLTEGTLAKAHQKLGRGEK